MFTEIFNQDQLLNDLQDLTYKITRNPNGCAVKIENQSPYALDVFNGTEHIDRINPYSFAVLQNLEYDVKVNRNIKTENTQPYNFVAVKLIQGDSSQKEGQIFNGTANVQGDMNVIGGQIDAYIKGDVKIDPNSHVNATVTGDVNITGTPKVEVVGETNVNIANTPTVQLAGDTTVNIGNIPQVEIVSGTVEANIQSALISAEIVNGRLSTNELSLIAEKKFNAVLSKKAPKGGNVMFSVKTDQLGAYNRLFIKIKSVGVIKEKVPNGKGGFEIRESRFALEVDVSPYQKMTYVHSMESDGTFTPSLIRRYVKDLDGYYIFADTTLNDVQAIDEIRLNIGLQDAITLDPNVYDEITIQIYGMITFRNKKEGGDVTFNSITFRPNRFFTSTNGAINLNNSDIIGANNIVFADLSNNNGEGLQFPKSYAFPNSKNPNDYDNFRILDGVVFINGQPLILSGMDSITPTANTPTTKRIYFSRPFTYPPSVVVSAVTTSPGATVEEISVGIVTKEFFDVWIYRTNTVTTNFFWIATPRSNGVG